MIWLPKHNTETCPSPLILSILEAAPLSAFLLLRWLIDARIPSDWLPVYLMPAALVLVCLPVVMRAVRPLNRLLLAIDLYLLLGALGLLADINPLNQALDRLQELGMLLAILAVGICCVLLRQPFLALPAGVASTRVSVQLLAVVLVTLLLAWPLRGQPLYHETLPFIALFAVHALMVRSVSAGARRARRTKRDCGR